MNLSDIQTLLQQYQSEGNDWSALASMVNTMSNGTKTPLGLNQWQQTDKPRMEHFNEDNCRIDELIREIRASLANKADIGPLQWYDFELSAGWEVWPGRGMKYAKDSFGIVHIFGEIMKDTAIISDEHVMALPEGFFPMFRSHYWAPSGGNNEYPVHIPFFLYTDGQIRVSNAVSDAVLTSYQKNGMSVNFSFPAQ